MDVKRALEVLRKFEANPDLPQPQVFFQGLEHFPHTPDRGDICDTCGLAAADLTNHLSRLNTYSDHQGNCPPAIYRPKDLNHAD